MEVSDKPHTSQPIPPVAQSITCCKIKLCNVANILVLTRSPSERDLLPFNFGEGVVRDEVKLPNNLISFETLQ